MRKIDQLHRDKIVVSTRDISYPGGTEVFVQQLLLYIAKSYQFQLCLFETDSHNGFLKPQLYEELVDAGIYIFNNSSINGRDLDKNTAFELQKVIMEQSPSLIHSFLFNSDYLVWLALYGEKHVCRALNSIPDYQRFREIVPGMSSLSPDADNGLKNKPTFLSSKMNDFSVALEETTVEWRDRKRIIDDQIEPLISRDTAQISAVSKRGVRKWQQWSDNEVLHLPCASIGKSDLTIIDDLAQNHNALRRKYGIRLDQEVYLVISRLVPGKGLEALLQAFEHFAQTYGDVKLLIAGFGELEDLVKEYAGRSQSISFLGRVDRHQVLELNVLANFFCLFSESEGLPLSIQEAMAAKTCVLASPVGGIPELIESGVHGLLSTGWTRKDIIETLLASRILSDQERLLMGKVARKKIEETYLRETVFDTIAYEYNKNMQGLT